MRSYLVTGGAGFIGSHLCDALLERGNRVLVIDDLSTGRPENLEHLSTHPHLTCIFDTVCNREALAPLIAQADAVFHLAAVVGVRLVVEKPVRTIRTNVDGTEAVLELAAPRRIPVLIASSSEVYGKSTKIPFSEDDDLVLGNTRVGRWAYGCSKALDEFLALAYAREHLLPTVVARLFNTVGPRQTGQYGMVLPTFVRQALSSNPITVYGDGQQQRCFCFVGEVVDALIQLIETPAASGRVFNIGSDEEIRVAELAQRVRTLCRSRSGITYIPYERAWDAHFEDLQRRVPDLTRIRELIGFRPRTSLDDIIARVIAYEAQESPR